MQKVFERAPLAHRGAAVSERTKRQEFVMAPRFTSIAAPHYVSRMARQKPRARDAKRATGAARRVGAHGRHVALGAEGDPLERNMGRILIALMAAMAVVLFGDYLAFHRLYLFKDIGSDTLNNFYPQRALVSNLLHHAGLPGWSFSMGLGQNVFPNLGDPFAWPLYLLSPRALAYAIAPLEVLKVLAAGGLFYALLRLRRVRPFAAAVVALCYAFAALIVVGGTWWYLLSNQAVHLALLLVAYELVLRGRSPWLFALAVAAIAAFNPLEPYLLGVVWLGYALVRYVADRDPEPGSASSTARRVAGVGVLGLAIGAVFALPTAFEMVRSPRIAGHSGLAGALLHASPLGLGDARLYATEILRTLATDLTGGADAYRGWQNYLEAPLTYAGLLPLLLVPQWFAMARRRERLAGAIVAGVLLLPFVFPWFRHAYWLFSGDYFRTLCLGLTLAILLAAATALDAIVRGRALHLRLLGGTLAVLVALLFLPYGGGAGSDPVLRGLVLALLVLEAACIVALARPNTRGMARLALLALVPIELVALDFAAVNQRPAVTSAEWNDRTGYHDETVDALALVRRQDTGFFRVEKSYASSPAADQGLNDSKVQDYFGTRSYYSFNPLEYIGFLGALGVIDASDPVQTNWAPGLTSRFVLQSVASVRYWLVRGDWRQVPMLAATYDSTGAAGDVTVLRSRAFVPFGFGVTRVVPASAFRRLSVARKDPTLLHAAVVADDDAAAQRALARFDTTAVALPYLLTAYEADAQACASHVMNMTRFGPNHIEGRVTAAEPRMWVFSFPHDPGWSARVDGKPVALRTVDAGLTGLLLTAGSHTITLTYAPPLRVAGAWISLVGMLTLAGFSLRRRFGPRRKPLPRG